MNQVMGHDSLTGSTTVWCREQVAQLRIRMSVEWANFPGGDHEEGLRLMICQFTQREIGRSHALKALLRWR